jgi:hypothetical protein
MAVIEFLMHKIETFPRIQWQLLAFCSEGTVDKYFTSQDEKVEE